MRTFYKTTFRVVVVSENKPSECYTVGDLVNCLGMDDRQSFVERTEIRELQPLDVVKEMFKHGETPDFFGLDEEGNELPRG